jgi:hypothetical protein
VVKIKDLEGIDLGLIPITVSETEEVLKQTTKN